jgi:hypothetical protein
MRNFCNTASRWRTRRCSITGNTQELYIHTNFTNSTKRVVHVTLDDLLTPAGHPAHPQSLLQRRSFPPGADRRAGDRGGRRPLWRRWRSICASGDTRPMRSHIISSACSFASLPKTLICCRLRLFTRLIDAGAQAMRSGSPAQVTMLFQAMADGGYFGEHKLRYFNGGLFDNAPVLDIDGDAINLLYDIAMLDWSSIEPAIFGTLFTRSLDPSQRAKLGAQYTSKDDIVLIVEPVLMAPLRKEWAGIQAEVQELAQKRDSALTQRATDNYQKQISSRIGAFAEKLATIRVLDPACGSGNFLYVALRLLLDLWKAVSIFASEMGLAMMTPAPGVSPSPQQLYGIEDQRLRPRTGADDRVDRLSAMAA